MMFGMKVSCSGNIRQSSSGMSAKSILSFLCSSVSSATGSPETKFSILISLFENLQIFQIENCEKSIFFFLNRAE